MKSDLIFVEKDFIVSRLGPIVRMLAECRDAASAKRVVDVAHAARIYAKRQRLSEETIAAAHAVKVDAMRLLGELLAKAEKNKGANGSRVTGSKREPVKDTTPTLAEIGISKKESSQAQALATIAAKGNGLFTEVRSGTRTVSEALRELQRRAAPTTATAIPEFDLSGESEAIMKWLGARRDGWPEDVRQHFIPLVRTLVDQFEAMDNAG